MPLKFGAKTLTSVTCARVEVSVRDQHGREARGWGETPLSVAWVWPSELDFALRHDRLKNFCETLTQEVAVFPASGHALEIGHEFINKRLPGLAAEESSGLSDSSALPHLAALVCFSAFDLAIHDAFGNLVGKPIYETYTSEFLDADFNCSVTDPAYVCDILDHLATEHSETRRIDVTSVSSRKPLYLDESAHDWTHVAYGKQRGWNGVALKTCKTQTGAILSLCWARAHGMGIMVQDLTNPMLAQIPHVLLAAHADTIMGVESNGMQFYPAASQAFHPGVYRRENGLLRIRTLTGSGFGYALAGLEKPPSPAAAFSPYFVNNEY